jgi:hypothetical protein
MTVSYFNSALRGEGPGDTLRISIFRAKLLLYGKEVN